jgi:hypothetical protein
MHLQRECPGNDVRYPAAVQLHESFAKHRLLLRRKLRSQRRTHRKSG